jgi:nuclear transport factor 2 (NTF2) superfamily protein
MSKELTIKEKNDKIKQFIFQKYQDGELDNSTLVELIILAGNYLNLKTIPDYAKDKGMTYSGVKNNREIIELFNVKFVIDNK